MGELEDSRSWAQFSGLGWGGTAPEVSICGPLRSHHSGCWEDRHGTPLQRPEGGCGGWEPAGSDWRRAWGKVRSLQGPLLMEEEGTPPGTAEVSETPRALGGVGRPRGHCGHPEMGGKTGRCLLGEATAGRAAWAEAGGGRFRGHPSLSHSAHPPRLQGPPASELDPVLSKPTLWGHNYECH